MSKKLHDFKDLRIWQMGIGIVKDIYAITRTFPKEELYGLTSQLRRSSISIPSNIAEGFRRYHNKEYAQFLRIALGSSAELETQLIICGELNYINNDTMRLIADKIEYLSKMTTVLLKKLG